MPQVKPSATVKPPKPVKERRSPSKELSERNAKMLNERKSVPASTPENREQQLINKAVLLAEKQLEDGTASAAVITHYLKLATKKEQLEREILQKQASMLEAKTISINQAKDNENIAKEAIEAMKSYGPSK